MSRAAALALACAALLAAGSADAINKCVDKAGKVTYQDGKCPDDARSSGTIYVPPPATPAAAPGVPGAPPGPPPQTDPAMAAAEDTLAHWDYCNSIDTEFAVRHVARYDNWKRVNERLYGRVNRDVDARDRVKAAAQRMRDDDRDKPPENRATRIGYCDASVPALFSRDIEETLGRKK